MLTDAPFVSVIVNCYNSAQYLREALDSVLAQSFSDWELVFWDNQSSDDSAAIFKSYSDQRFHYYYSPEHTALGRARNLAVEQARGDWIAFLDCDDLWLPQKLEKQVSIIRDEGRNLGMVYGKARIKMEVEGAKTGWVRGMETYGIREGKYLPEGDIFTALLKENFVPMSSGVVLRSAYWSVGGIDSSYNQGEDYDLFVKISKEYKARAVQEIVCDYRIHSSNLSHLQLTSAYLEAIEIVSRYLPTEAAKCAVQSYQTSFAVVEIQDGAIVKGVSRLLFHGDILLFISKLGKYVWRRLLLLMNQQ